MKSEIHHISEFEKELDISVPWEMVKEEYDDLLKYYSKATLKGFRPGKAPLGAIESTFRNELKSDLARGCSTRFCRKVLKENKMEAASPLEITMIQLDKNSRFSFKASFIEMPLFDLPDYANLSLQSKEEEEMLNEISEKLLDLTNISIPPLLIKNELLYSELEDGTATEADSEAAEERVKLMLILKKIAALEQIEIDDKDIEERIESIALENEVTAEQLKEFLISNGGITRLSDALLAEQVLKFIISIQK